MPPRLFDLEGPSYEECAPQLPKCSNCIVILDLGGTFTQTLAGGMISEWLKFTTYEGQF